MYFDSFIRFYKIIFRLQGGRARNILPAAPACTERADYRPEQLSGGDPTAIYKPTTCNSKPTACIPIPSCAGGALGGHSPGKHVLRVYSSGGDGGSPNAPKRRD